MRGTSLELGEMKFLTHMQTDVRVRGFLSHMNASAEIIDSSGRTVTSLCFPTVACGLARPSITSSKLSAAFQNLLSNDNDLVPTLHFEFEPIARIQFLQIIDWKISARRDWSFTIVAE